MPVERVVPMMLFDHPDDWPEVCWIETIVGDEDAARDALAEHCVGEASDSPPFRPVGPATREWHRRTDRMTPDGEVWEKCSEGDDGRRGVLEGGRRLMAAQQPSQRNGRSEF